jgi:hypothetical protein
MASTIQVDKIQDTGGNTILSSNSTGTFTNNLPANVIMLDQWVCTGNQSISADTETLITGSWADYGTTDSGANIGSSMTESSGIFSFPETGIYTIDFMIQIAGAGGANDQVQAYFYVTTNDSTYTDVNDPGGFFADAGDRYTGCGHFALDVTDISNVKVKFTAYSATVAAQVQGDPGRMRSGVTFMKVAAT